MDEEKQEENTQEVQESTTEDSKNRLSPKMEAKAKMIEDAENAAEELNKANADKAELLDREEELHAKRVLGGFAEGGSQPVKEEKLTDIEYAKKLQRGEVNPLKEDGFI